MCRNGIAAWAGLLGLLLLTPAGCVTVNLLPMPGPLQERVLSGTGTAKVLVVELDGVISSADPRGLVDRPSLVAHVREVLTVAEQDQDVKALVLRVNTPGGTVTASDILHHEVLAFKEKRKIPVVVSIMDLGTSGGYYVATAGDKIVAHPSSVTGSLGVIMLTVNASGLLEKIGVETTAVASGPKKDMGSPLRPMTAEERAIFQDVIDEFHAQFLRVIERGRPNLTAKQVQELADGRIYSGEQALKLGLIDQVGYVEDAVTLAKKEAGLDEARVVTYHRPGEYRHNIYSSFFGSAGPWPEWARLDLMGLLRTGQPQFMYLWLP